MNNKKAIALVPLALGAIVLMMLIYGLGNLGYMVYKEKIIGEKGVLKAPVSEREFVPYVGAPLSEEEKTVLNSANALRCALNSVALGEYRPDDEKVCPAPLDIAPPSIARATGAVSGLAWVDITGRTAAPKKYDKAEVHCDGTSVDKFTLPKDKDASLKIITQAILNCKARAMDKDVKQDTRCARLNVLDWESSSTDRATGAFIKGDEYDEDQLTAYMKAHKAEFPGWEPAIDYLTSLAGFLGWKGQNFIEVQTSDGLMKKRTDYDGMLCVDYRRGNVLNYISVNGCDLGATEQFYCEVKNFNLPQPEVADSAVADLFIGAYGDPRWLVYYESFPQEATEYWHKKWTDMFNLWTIGTVTAAGFLNMLGGGKAAKVVQKTAQKEAQKLAKEGAEALVKKGITEAEKAIIERLGKAGVENTMKSMLAQNALTGAGMSVKAAERITKEVFEAVGKRSGARAFNKAKDQIETRIAKVLEEEFAAATPEFRKQLLKEIMEGGDRMVLKLGNEEVTGGLQALITRDLRKQLAGNIIKRRAYEKFLAELVNPDGTINANLLRNNAEAALKNLDNIAKINPTAAQKAWAGTREMLDIFMGGTFGGFTTRDFQRRPAKTFFKFLSDQSPIKFSGGGFVVGGTVLKTAVGLPRWVATHSYPIVLLLAWYIDAQDSLNEKFKPAGGNAIAINQPTLLGPTLPLGLHDSAFDYFVHNHIKGGVNPALTLVSPIATLMTSHSKYGQRMYYVSPCKADMKVYKRKCTCYKNPAMHKFTYPTGTINVEPGSVVPLNDAVLEAKLRQRWKDTAKAVRLEAWRSQWNALDQDSKNKFGTYDNYAEEQFIDEQFDNYDAMFFSEVVAPVGGIVKGRSGVINWLAGTRNVQGGLSAQMTGERMKSMYDASNAIKICDQEEFIKSSIETIGVVHRAFVASFVEAWGYTDPTASKELQRALLNDEYFKPDCLEVEPQRKGGYCYDFFPNVEWLRNLVLIADLVSGAVIIGFTGGLATPLWLLGVGLTSAALDVVLEAWEKWP